MEKQRVACFWSHQVRTKRQNIIHSSPLWKQTNQSILLLPSLNQNFKGLTLIVKTNHSSWIIIFLEKLTFCDRLLSHKLCNALWEVRSVAILTILGFASHQFRRVHEKSCSSFPENCELWLAILTKYGYCPKAP